MDLEELYDKLYRYCYMKTRHPQTAEDLTQEAFLHFLRTPGRKRDQKADGLPLHHRPQSLH